MYFSHDNDNTPPRYITTYTPPNPADTKPYIMNNTDPYRYNINNTNSPSHTPSPVIGTPQVAGILKPSEPAPPPPPMLAAPPARNFNELPQRTKYMPDTRFEFKPRYLYSPWAIFRWVQVILGLTVMFLMSMTCRWRCVVIISDFGRVAEGLGYNAFAGFLVALLTVLVIAMTSCNLHRSAPGIMRGLETAVYVLCALLLVILAIIMSYYASASQHPDYFDLARGHWGGIRPQWIAAAILAWINFVLYVVDLVGQCCTNYPSIRLTNI